MILSILPSINVLPKVDITHNEKVNQKSLFDETSWFALWCAWMAGNLPFIRAKKLAKNVQILSRISSSHAGTSCQFKNKVACQHPSAYLTVTVMTIPVNLNFKKNSVYQLNGTICSLQSKIFHFGWSWWEGVNEWMMEGWINTHVISGCPFLILTARVNKLSRVSRISVLVTSGTAIPQVSAKRRTSVIFLEIYISNTSLHTYPL